MGFPRGGVRGGEPENYLKTLAGRAAVHCWLSALYCANEFGQSPSRADWLVNVHQWPARFQVTLWPASTLRIQQPALEPSQSWTMAGPSMTVLTPLSNSASVGAGAGAVSTISGQG